MEGDTDIIPPQALQSIDNDSSPEELVYSFLPPSNGEVIVRGFPGTLSSFSQKDLEQGMVQFMHRGELDGGFFFKVSDGENESEQHFFHVKAIPITIHMQKMQTLTACPQSLQQITREHLNAVTNEGKSTQPILMYHIEDAPQIGQIRHEGNVKMSSVTNFTQSDVDEGLIYYQHVNTSSPFWITQDHFSFRVHSPRATSHIYILNVTVTFQGSCPQLKTHLWKNAGLDIIQGSSSPITSSCLDASNLLANPSNSRLTHDVVFFITNFPSKGHLSLHGVILSPQTPYFFQSHLENGTLLYTNTKADSLHDSFQFKAQPHPKFQSYHGLNNKDTIWTVTESFNITFTDLPMVPDIIHLPKSKLYLAVGANVSLTPDYIPVHNSMVYSDEIIYSIEEAPLGISFATGGNQSMPLTQFTQHELASSMVFLFANLTAMSGEIILNISSGHQSHIEKLPINILPVYEATIAVRQASGRSLITMAQIKPIPGKTETCIYKITKKPSYGDIVVGQVPVTDFNEEQINKNEVYYTFTSFLSNQDNFEYLVISDQGKEAVGKVTVEVSPMVKIGSKQKWPRGCTVRLGTDVVDASELGALTKSVPQFRVVQHPREGDVVRFPYEGGRGEASSTYVFTQQELESGLIGVALRKDEQNGTGIKGDRLHLVLSASQVPSANVTLRFSTVPYDSSQSYSATLLRSAGDSVTPTVEASTTALPSTRIFTTNSQSPSAGSTVLLESMTSEPTTQLQITATFSSTVVLITTKHLDQITTSAVTPTLEATTYPDISKDSTNTVTEDFGVLDELTTSTTQDLFINITSGNTSTIPGQAREGTLLGFMNTHMYSVILPICLVLLLILLGLLLLAYFVRRKKMGKHHVQKAATSAAKTENGAADRQTFRPTEPERDIPLCDVGGQRGNGAGGNGQPGSQYWV